MKHYYKSFFTYSLKILVVIVLLFFLKMVVSAQSCDSNLEPQFIKSPNATVVMNGVTVNRLTNRDLFTTQENAINGVTCKTSGSYPAGYLWLRSSDVNYQHTVTYTFSKPQVSVQVVLYWFGDYHYTNQTDKAIFTINGGGTLSLSGDGCHNHTVINGNRITSTGKLTDAIVTVTASKPFTTLTITDPLVNNWVYYYTGFGYFVELCPESVSADSDGDGIEDNADLDADNDGILDTDEGYCSGNIPSVVAGSVKTYSEIGANALQTIDYELLPASKRMIAVFVSYEREHYIRGTNFASKQLDTGDNSTSSLEDDVPDIGFTVGGRTGNLMEKFILFNKTEYPNTDELADTYYSVESYVYLLRLNAEDTGTLQLDLSDARTPTDDGDVTKVTVLTLKDVDGYQLKRADIDQVTNSLTVSDNFSANDFNLVYAVSGKENTFGNNADAILVEESSVANSIQGTFYYNGYDYNTGDSDGLSSTLLSFVKDGFAYVTINTGSNYASKALQIAVLSFQSCTDSKDTDNDGTPDYLGLDSDGDGCPDAVEGGDNVLLGHLDADGRVNVGQDGNLVSSTNPLVDTNGVPTIVNSGGTADTDNGRGQTVDNSQNASVNTACDNVWVGGNTPNEWNNGQNWTQLAPPIKGGNITFATKNNNPTIAGNPLSGPAQTDLHVPGTPYSPTIIGNLTNMSGKALVVPAGNAINVTGILTGYSSSDNANRLVIKAEANKPNGAFLGGTCDNAPYATVELYSKGKFIGETTWKDNIVGSPTNGTTFKSSYSWQQFGVPVSDLADVNPIFYKAWIRSYHENYNGKKTQFYQKWKPVTNGMGLTPFAGYEITQPENVEQTYILKGKLNTCDHTLILTRQAPFVTGSTNLLDGNNHYGLGQNVFGNSYTASIAVSTMEFNPPSTSAYDQLDETVYLYNTGRFTDWANTNPGHTPNGGINITGTVAGQYTAIPKATASYLNAPYGGRIPSMNGFLLRFADDATVYNRPNATVKVKCLATHLLPNTKPQTVKREALSSLIIDLYSQSTIDRLYLYSQEGTSDGFDNGWDGRKFFGTPTAFIYSETEAGAMQVNTSEDLDGKIITFYANEDSEYTLCLNKNNLDDYTDLHLLDLATGAVVSLDKKQTTYKFTAKVKSVTHRRFKLVNSANITDDMFDVGNNIFVQNYDKNLRVTNFTDYAGVVQVFDISGRLVQSHKMTIGVNLYNLNLEIGTYIVEATTGLAENNVKLIVK